MVIMFIETKIETMGKDYRSKQRGGELERALLLRGMTIKE